jgi:hypothetical protein
VSCQLFGEQKSLVIDSSHFKYLQGVAIQAHALEDGRLKLSLGLVDWMGQVLTCAIIDNDDIVAAWRSFARASSLSLMIVDEHGLAHRFEEKIGTLILGETTPDVRQRRGVSTLKGRRSRFMRRRKTGALPERPTVHRSWRK